MGINLDSITAYHVRKMRYNMKYYRKATKNTILLDKKLKNCTYVICKRISAIFWSIDVHAEIPTYNRTGLA